MTRLKKNQDNVTFLTFRQNTLSFHPILRNVSLSPYQTTMRLVQIIGKDVAHLVDRMTGIPLMQVGFPGVAKDFFSELTLSFGLSSGVRNPRVQSVRVLKIFVSMSEFGGL